MRMGSSGEDSARSFWQRNEYQTKPPYTSLEEIVAYSPKTHPWWKKGLSGPSPDLETNFIVRECTLGALLVNALPAKTSAPFSCLRRKLRLLLEFLANGVSIRLRSERRIAM